MKKGRELVHDIYRPFLTYFRRRRILELYRKMRLDSRTRVVDVGGDPFFWSVAAALGLPLPRLVLVNLKVPDDRSGRKLVLGDARRLPFADRAFDVAISNSVIEHLSDRDGQERLASEIRRVADGYFVQTPDFAFPVEPHYLTPFVHWVGRPVRARLLRNFTVWGLMTRPTAEEVRHSVAEIRLLSAAEMRRLFPDAETGSERFCGLSKSIVSAKPPAGTVRRG